MEKNVLYMIIGGAVLFAVGVFVGKSLSHPYGFRGGMHRADCPFAMNAPVANPCNCGMMGCGCAQPNAPVNIAPDCNCGQVPPAPRREPEPRMKGEHRPFPHHARPLSKDAPRPMPEPMPVPEPK